MNEEFKSNPKQRIVWLHDLEGFFVNELRFVGVRKYAILPQSCYNALPVFAKSEFCNITKTIDESRSDEEGIRIIDACGVEYEACSGILYTKKDT